MNDSDNADRTAYLVGAGLASLAAAVYLLKDGNLKPENITIFECRSRAGGSLGIFGDVETGFVYPGGRVFEEQYRCALDLLSQIPSSRDPGTSIKQEIMEFNARYGWHNNARLVDMNRNVVDTSRLDLEIAHYLSLAKLLLSPERWLNGKRIGEVVDTSFFKTNFWFIWSSIMAFRPNHSAIEMRRYLLRYLHLLPELSTMTFILRTRVNQQQAIVDPLVALTQSGPEQSQHARRDAERTAERADMDRYFRFSAF